MKNICFYFKNISSFIYFLNIFSSNKTNYFN